MIIQPPSPPTKVNPGGPPAGSDSINLRNLVGGKRAPLNPLKQALPIESWTGALSNNNSIFPPGLEDEGDSLPLKILGGAHDASKVSIQ